MMTTLELHSMLENTEYIGDKLIPAHSDHYYYEQDKERILADKMPLRQSLNGTWKFKYSRNLWERPELFYEDGFDISEFDDIVVPGHIEMQGYDRCHYTNVSYPWEGTEDLNGPEISKDYAPVGSYARDFVVEKNLQGKRLFISFQGVEVAFRVFVNGVFAGYSEDSFTPAEFEITDFVRTGSNRLAVEVYKRSSAIWLEDQDMWRFFGIFREVYLFAVPKLHVADMFVKATLDDNYDKGVLDINATLWGNASKAVAKLYLDKEICGEYPMQLSDDKATLRATGLSVLHWSAEEPNLYELVVEVSDSEGRVVEYATTKIGFRTFEIKNKLMLINGKRIVFRGVNRHEFSAKYGRACTYEEMLWDIRTFKRNNINAVRTSHYPNQSMWYRLCDEYGIYMIDETNLETHGTWFTGELQKRVAMIPWSKPEWHTAVMSRAEHMFMRDKNHAAVLMWSLGNESFGGTNFYDMHDYFRRVDDTRIVHYEGVTNSTEFSAATDVKSHMYLRPADIRNYLSNNPEKPYISCEYMHAMGNSLGGMKLYTDLEDEFDMYQGGFIWDYLDQAIWQEHDGEMRLAYGGDFGDRPTEYCFCTDGIVFAQREESPKCAEVKKLYANVHLSADRERFTVENRNLFIDLSRYYFKYVVTENGRTIHTEYFSNINTKPGATETFRVSGDVEYKAENDYTVRIEMYEKYDTKWADRDFQVCFAEETYFAKKNPALTEIKNAPADFKHFSSFMTYHGVTCEDKVSAMFSVYEGGPVSFKYGETEMLSHSARPTFFRAYTDNDKGFHLGEKSHFWHMLSLYQKARFLGFTKEADCAQGVFEYLDPSNDEARSKVTYRIYPDGRIKVKINYFGKENLPILPLFGWEMKIDKQYNNVEYFGMGPGENYLDRNNGSYTDIFKTTVDKNLTPYLVPQEVGNRTNVRWAKVTNGEGHGFLFAAEEGTFDFSFLPYSAYEMENATHLDELPRRQYTWIRVIAAQMGVGGDDSWGAPVQEKFRLDSSKDMELNFELRIF